VELVVGSRRIPGGGAEAWTWYRRGLSSLGTWVARRCLRVDLADPLSGFFTMDRRFYERVRDRVNPRGYKILLECYVRGRPTSAVELPYRFRNRHQGYSKLTAKVAYDYLAMVWSLMMRP